LTGSQNSGDAYVAATLEALIEDPGVLDQSIGPRVGLYRLFTKIWSSVSVNGATEPPEPSLPVEQRLAHITPRARQAFLLIALEGFSEDEAAQSARSAGGTASRVVAAGWPCASAPWQATHIRPYRAAPESVGVCANTSNANII